MHPPHVALGEPDRTNICYLAFPDSNSGVMGDSQFHFRLRLNQAAADQGGFSMGLFGPILWPQLWLPFNIEICSIGRDNLIFIPGSLYPFQIASLASFWAKTRVDFRV